jgi:hypothetical protein
VVVNVPTIDYAIAIHEAGHTLMAYLCGVPFLYVAIASAEVPECGRLEIENYPDDTWDLSSPKIRHTVESVILVCLAGYLAQCRDVAGAGRFNIMHSVDYSEAWKWCQRLAGTSEEPPQSMAFYVGASGCCTTHRQMAIEQFDRFGEAYQPAIHNLAFALLERRTLSAEEVTGLFIVAGNK